MSSMPAPVAAELSPAQRLEVLFEELAELTGQRNAIDGRIMDIVAEIDHDGLWGGTGVRSISALVAWKTGVSPRNADTVVAIADRLEAFPRLTQGLRQGRLSLDQVGVIAENAADGSDEHYIELAEVATVTQLRTAVSLEPRPDPAPRPEPQPSITKTPTGPGGEHVTWKITLPRVESAKFEAAVDAHREALITEWKHDRDNTDDTDTDGGADGERRPMPTQVDAFNRLVEAGWDAEATARAHGQHTTVIVHVDIDTRVGALHLGPLLSDDDRRYLTCDATCEVWFERHGRLIGTGRTTRTVNRRLRRALEHRDRTCVVPGCGATRGLHAHHITHWEDGGPTDLHNLVLVCPFHHRAHHRGEITLSGTAHHLTVTHSDGQALTNASLARPPTTPPPEVPPCPGPLGERADWWWYDPFQPQPPPSAN